MTPRKRLCAAALTLLLTGCGIAACGGAGTPRTPHLLSANALNATGCMGGSCRPTLKLGAAPAKGQHHAQIPDVSEWQPCVDRSVPTVIRLYESGTARQDSHAACNAAVLRHVWFGGYTFLRPGSCVGEASATVGVIRRIGGLNGPVIADAEVPLPGGFVRCFLAEVHRLLPHYPTATYTGCYSGIEIVGPWWVPDYGVSAPCTRGGRPYVAWQDTDGSFCGERFVTDCSLDFGILGLHVKHPHRELLEADIARREAQKAQAAIAEHSDLLLIEFWRSRRPQTTALRRDAYRRERLRAHLLSAIVVDNRLIALWRRRL